MNRHRKEFFGQEPIERYGYGAANSTPGRKLSSVDEDKPDLNEPEATAIVSLGIGNDPFCVSIC